MPPPEQSAFFEAIKLEDQRIQGEIVAVIQVTPPEELDRVLLLIEEESKRRLRIIFAYFRYAQ